MFGPHPDDETRLATKSEAVDEWARNCEAPAHVAWLLHDYDVWVRNPRYTGAPVSHPEDDTADDFFEDDDRPVSYWDKAATFKAR